MLGWIAKAIAHAMICIKEFIINTFINATPGMIFGVPTVF